MYQRTDGSYCEVRMILSLATVLMCGTMQETASLCRVFSLDAEAIEVLTVQGREAGKMACIKQIN